jgi:hypothetical protein
VVAAPPAAPVAAPLGLRAVCVPLALLLHPETPYHHWCDLWPERD